MEKVGAVVIGAGVIGLACGRAMARRGIETLILERHNAFGTEISARNSEVIHAGLYYPSGSLKARLCVDGRRRLYDFCASHGVDHRRCGKLVVATAPEQEVRLKAMLRQSLDNGVDDLRLLSAAEARALEPELQCAAALFSPSTGIIDSHGLMRALLGDAQRDGAVLALNSPVQGGVIRSAGIELEIGGAEPMRLQSDRVINATGLSAPALVSRIAGFPSFAVPRAYLAKGSYFSLNGRSPFSRLVYPLPEPGGLGVHLTLDLAGQARFGPDVEWIATADYAVNPARAESFYAEVRRYWPGLADGALAPAYAGIRPKISGPGEAAADFLIQGEDIHGIPGWINLFGIESPGLTACLALADHVAEHLA
ncbi:NAD(P)/FAD-dependent oxidoreductase [bacterium]|nr:NAD(P)/FAD-dependent oxidoreductase [bacterium]